MPLQTVEPQRLYRQIAEQLRKLMAGGEFATGSRLPAERDLAKQLGVSRPSVREALIALEVEGWVEVRTGSGVYVLERARRVPGKRAKVPAAEWGPLELIRARRVIEGEIASLAAAHAKRKDIQAIRDALARMREDTDRCSSGWPITSRPCRPGAWRSANTRPSWRPFARTTRPARAPPCRRTWT